MEKAYTNPIKENLIHPLPSGKKVNYLKILQYIFFIILLLYFGKSLFIPLTYALFISLIIYPWCKWLEKKGISRSISIIISLFIIFLVLASVVLLFVTQLTEFIKEWPAIEVKLLQLLENIQVYLTEIFHFSKTEQSDWINNLIKGSFSQFLPVLKTTLYFSSVSLVLILLIPIYIALILYYRRNLLYFLYSLFSYEYEQKKNITFIVSESIVTYSNFIKGMILVYLIVGILNSVGLFLIGIPNPLFFGFAASVLTIIPYVGITLGSLLPISAALITFDSFLYPLGVIAIFTLVQVLEAYIIFPISVGSRLKINTLITLVVIIGGGLIWGVSGMILFLPFVAILKIVADKVPDFKPLSVLLGSETIRITEEKE